MNEFNALYSLPLHTIEGVLIVFVHVVGLAASRTSWADLAVAWACHVQFKIMVRHFLRYDTGEGLMTQGRDKRQGEWSPNYGKNTHKMISRSFVTCHRTSRQT